MKEQEDFPTICYKIFENEARNIIKAKGIKEWDAKETTIVSTILIITELGKKIDELGERLGRKIDRLREPLWAIVALIGTAVVTYVFYVLKMLAVL